MVLLNWLCYILWLIEKAWVNWLRMVILRRRIIQALFTAASGLHDKTMCQQVLAAVWESLNLVCLYGSTVYFSNTTLCFATGLFLGMHARHTSIKIWGLVNYWCLVSFDGLLFLDINRSIWSLGKHTFKTHLFVSFRCAVLQSIRKLKWSITRC